MMSLRLFFALTLLTAGSALQAQNAVPLVTGKSITPEGRQTAVGSFPANMLLSPDGRHVVVTNTGYRQFLSVLSAQDGHLESQVPLNSTSKLTQGRQEGTYYGLAFLTHGATTLLYVSRGPEERVVAYTLASDGTLAEAPIPALKVPHLPAGLALSSDGSRLYAASNEIVRADRMQSSLSILDTTTGTAQTVTVPGSPYGVAAITTGPRADRKVYAACERDGVVTVVDPQAAKVVRTIRTGAQPMALLLDKAQERLYVANAGSDTVSVVDTATDRVIRSILLRPDDVRGLPGVTPTGLALSPDGRTLYATLADMNAVAVVGLPDGRLAGYIPVGWYPTSVAVSADGQRLFVANAKGVNLRNPNGKPAGPNGQWGQYIENIIEGTVSTIDAPDAAGLLRMTQQTITNNRVNALDLAATRNILPQTGIQHVIYIIKENRTYDQVLGDVARGNGDPSLTLFGRDVTPNQHALVERFALLDNFYCCAEVSADGWCWSTSGMASEYTVRNAPYGYSGRGHAYDYEGETSSVPVDLFGMADVARAPGGYIWDLVAKKGLSYRNYGFYVTNEKGEITLPDGVKHTWAFNSPDKKVLVNHTNVDYLQFDMRYADSEAWVTYNAPAPSQMKSYGTHNSPSRFTEWKREFDQFVREGSLPRFTMIRLPRDHTAGTAPGLQSPRAMAADNDYAVGQIVEAVSKSPFWKSTAILILEDDAQNGFDHVDAHRSTCYVISPWVRKSVLNQHFYNTDSVLRTIEALLGLPAMSQYDAIASPIDVFDNTPANDAPYTAILPPKQIIAEFNKPTAYRAKDSLRFDFSKADAVPDDELNDILWHSMRGSAPKPPIRYSLRLGPREDD